MSDDTDESDSGKARATEDEAMAEGEHEPREEHPDAEGGGTHGQVEPVATRETAPMSEFTWKDVGSGIVVLVIGLLITVAIPLLFTL